MRDNGIDRCKLCGSGSNLSFCKKCASLICPQCVETVFFKEYHCQACNSTSLLEHCDDCNLPTQPKETRRLLHCPICKSQDLSDPRKTIQEIPDVFLQTLKTLEADGHRLLESHRKFDRMVAIVRIGREAGYYGYPTIEEDLRRMVKVLGETTQIALDELNSIRKSSAHVIRELRGFKNLELDLYPIFISHLKILNDKISLFQKRLAIQYEKINEIISEIAPKLESLNGQRENFDKIRDLFPADLIVSGIIATLNELNIEVEESNLKKHKMKGSLVFLDKGIIICSKSTSNVYKFPYTDLLETRIMDTYFKISRLEVILKRNTIRVFGVPADLNLIKNYFDWVQQHYPNKLAVSSSEDIQLIDLRSPDGSTLRREIQALITEVLNQIKGQGSAGSPNSMNEGQAQIRNRIYEINAKIDYLTKTYATYPVTPENVIDQILALKQEKRFLLNQLNHYGLSSPIYGNASKKPTPSPNRYGLFKSHLN